MFKIGDVVQRKLGGSPTMGFFGEGCPVKNGIKYTVLGTRDSGNILRLHVSTCENQSWEVYSSDMEHAKPPRVLLPDWL